MGQLTYTTQEVQDRLDAVGTLVRPNLLDNAYFVGGGSQQGGGQFPINQRGQTSYGTNGYTIDRWLVTSMNGYGTLTVNSAGLKLTHADNGGYISLLEPLENSLSGKEVTLSALIDDLLYSSTYTVGETDLVGLWGNLEVYKTKPSDYGGAVFMLRGNKPTGATIQAVKLELGDTQTLAHWDEAAQKWVLNEVPNYQQELAKCQRYYVPLYNVRQNFVGPHFVGYSYASDKASVFVPTPVEMRTSPSVTVINSGSLKQSGTIISNSPQISIDTATPIGVKIIVNASGQATNQPVDLADPKIVFSADL